MLSKTDQAIVLRTRSYGEADTLVTFFTERDGKISAMAKGGAKSRRRFGGALDTGAFLKIVYEEKPHRELVLLKEAAVEGRAQPWRKAWETFAMASYALELVLRMLPESHPSPEKFAFLKNFLEQLVYENAPQRLLEFEAAWLALTGFGSVGHLTEESPEKLQKIFDRHWLEILGRPPASQSLLQEALLCYKKGSKK